MPKSLKMQAGNALRVAVALTPWLISMYVLYWLEYGEVWSTETAHRGKATVVILVVGMGLSFLIQSRLAKRKQK